MDGLAVVAPQGRIRVWRGATGGTGRTWAALTVTFAVLGAAIVGPGAASRTKGFTTETAQQAFDPFTVGGLGLSIVETMCGLVLAAERSSRRGPQRQHGGERFLVLA